MKMNPISERKFTKFPATLKTTESGIDLNFFFKGTSLTVEDWMETADGAGIILHVRSTESEANCTHCGQVSARVHDRYVRRLQDLPAFGKNIHVHFHTRKFRCDNPDCSYNTFAEQPGKEIFRHRRRTRRCEEIVHRLGLHLSSIQASAQLNGMGVEISKSTVLRDLHRMRIPERNEVRRIGVDDWAFRKGKDYGSIIVDLSTGKPLDLLPGRTEGDLSQWLASHRQVWLMSRDRATSYSAAAGSCGFPVTEIADRFHLMKNMGECVADTICSRYGDIARHIGADPSTGMNTTDNDGEILYDQLSRSVRMLAAEGKNISEIMSLLGVGVKFVRRHLKPEKSREADEGGTHPVTPRKKGYVYEGPFNEVKRLQKEGVGVGQTAELLGLSKRTVEKYRGLDTFPKPRRKYNGATDPHAEFVEQQYARGRSLEETYRTLRSQGLQLGRTNFFNHFKYLSDGHHGCRTAAQQAKMEADWQKGLVNTADRPRPILPTVRELTHTLMKSVLEKGLSAPETRLISSLGELDWFRELMEAAATFRQNLRSGCPSRMDAWVKRYEHSANLRLKKFVNGIKMDIDGVRNAVLFRESNGITEGYVNKLKTVKRSMYGRAKLDLLKVKMVMPSYASH